MIQFRIRYDGPVPGIARRELNAVKKAVFGEVGVFWHRRFRPKHFTIAGGREYGYTSRKGEEEVRSGRAFRRSYTGRKFRRFGHTLPLVFSGQSRGLSRLRDVRATGRGVRVVIRAPALNRRPRGGEVNPRDEMTRVSDREARKLVELFGRSLNRGLNAVRKRQTVRA